MVFQYIGSDPSHRYRHCVLRLSKHSTKPEQPTGKSICACQASYEFLRDVIRPRMSAELLLLGELIPVNKDFLDQLHSDCVSLRPLHRLKTSLDTHATLGWLMPDLSYLPSFGELAGELAISQASVEIKPKCGILPQIDCIESENSIKSTVSRFQMMQFLKLVEGRVVNISRYNPIEFYSGEIEPTTSALRALISDPQNNFRLWIDQAECISDASGLNSQSISKFLSIAFESSDEISELSKILATIIIDCRVLDEIRRLQKLDRFDIESVGLIYRHLSNPSTFSPADVRQQAPCSYLPVASHSAHHLVALFQQPSFFVYLNLTSGDQESEWEQVVEDFLIAQSAKDCSIMISMVLMPRATGPSSPPIAPLRCVDCLDPPCTITYRVALVSCGFCTSLVSYKFPLPACPEAPHWLKLCIATVVTMGLTENSTG